MLFNDLEPIVFKLPQDIEEIHVYGIGDVHVGAPGWDEKLTKRKVQMILDDPVGYVHLCGDLMNNGLKNSKTNTYEEKLMPMEQKDWIIENLEPLKDRIISAVPGNHEDRTTRDAGLSPMYDIMCIWGISERYRENMALSIVKFGRAYNGRYNCYGGLCTHGSTKNKHEKFALCFDGIDYAISGHTHTPSYTPKGKIKLDLQKGRAKHIGYSEIVVDAGMKPSDYGLKKEYLVSTPPRMDYLVLHPITKGMTPNPSEKKIDYCSIQI